MLGAHNVRLASEPGRVEITSRVHVEHPNWNPNNLRGDVAIITLPEPVTFTGKHWLDVQTADHFSYF
jgi:Trypsin